MRIFLFDIKMKDEFSYSLAEQSVCDNSYDTNYAANDIFLCFFDYSPAFIMMSCFYGQTFTSTKWDPFFSS